MSRRTKNKSEEDAVPTASRSLLPSFSRFSRSPSRREKAELMDSEILTEADNSCTGQKVRTGIRPERLFLILSIFFGLLFAAVQPLFIEPDAGYHFDHAMLASNTFVNRASVGFPTEDYASTPVPFTTVTGMMKNGTYFKNFFETKLPLVPQSQVKISSTAGYDNTIMHLVPGWGVKVGYALYPSIGSMVLTARLFNLIFFVLAMFFIIKQLKAYRLLFVAVSVSPTVIQTATSLSYDCYNYVACALMTMALINLAVDFKAERDIGFFSLILRLLVPSVVLYFAKVNSKLLYLLVILVLLALLARKLRFSFGKSSTTLLSVLAVILSVLYFFARYSNYLSLIGSKVFYTILEPYYTVFTTEVLGGTSTVGVPAWFYLLEVTVLALLFLSYSEEVVPRWFAWGSLTVVLINFFGVLLTYAIDHSYLSLTITGAQGRYFTSFILLLPPFFTLLARKITVRSGRWLRKAVILVAVMALVLNLSITALRSYGMHLPLDEIRSGLEHYIFK